MKCDGYPRISGIPTVDLSKFSTTSDKNPKSIEG